jgi:hypothetical protein
MNNCKFLQKVLLGFLFVMLTNGLAFAERVCTNHIVTSNGVKEITTDCSSTYTQTSENFTNQFLFTTLIDNLRDRVNSGVQDFQDRLAAIFSSQAQAQQIASDLREKEQEEMETQQMKRQEQEIQLENLKYQQQVQKDQQASMQHRI